MSWLLDLRRKFGDDGEGLIYAVADALFQANNRSKGAMLPGGFGFLDTAKQGAWKRRAHRLLSADRREA